jgi:hypothetical protein
MKRLQLACPKEKKKQCLTDQFYVMKKRVADAALFFAYHSCEKHSMMGLALL